MSKKEPVSRSWRAHLRRQASARKGVATRRRRAQEKLVVLPAIVIDLVQGVEGFSVYLNGHRIAGSKPWGGGQAVGRWFVRDEDLDEAIRCRGKRSAAEAADREKAR